MRLVGISGSLRRGSYNTALIDAAAAELPEGAELVRVSGPALRLLPFYDETLDRRGAVAAVPVLRRTLAGADAVLIATPEYNGSMPGVLKNLLDWASRPYPGNCLLDKPVAVIGASTGYFGGAWAQADLRRVLTVIGACVLETELRIPTAQTAFAEDGALRDPAHTAALRAIVGELLATKTTLRCAA